MNDTPEDNTPDQGEADAVGDLTVDEAEVKLDAIQKEVDAQGFIDMMKSLRMRELRRHIYLLRVRASIPMGATPA